MYNIYDAWSAVRKLDFEMTCPGRNRDCNKMAAVRSRTENIESETIIDTPSRRGARTIR